MRLDSYVREWKKNTRLTIAGVLVLLLFAAFFAVLILAPVFSPVSHSVFINSSSSPVRNEESARIPSPVPETILDPSGKGPVPNLEQASPGSDVPLPNTPPALRGIPVEKTRAEQKYVAGQVIVRYKPDSPNKKIAGARARAGAENVTRIPGTGNEDLAIISLPEGSDVEEAVARIAQDPAVLSAQPDYLYQLAVLPDDPDFTLQWGLQKPGLSAMGINGPDAWDITSGSRGTVIAVIDTGIDYNHPDLQDNIWTNSGETGIDPLGHDRRFNGVDDDADGYVDDWRGWSFADNTSDIMDTNGHGTAVSGIIGAAGNNGIGVSGTNWQVSIMPLDASNGHGALDTASILLAIRYAKDHGASVVSGSWGGYSLDPLLRDTIENNPDILFVFAAGNDGSNNDISPFYPASYPFDNIISVAANNQDGSFAFYSNYGLTSVDIAAPGTLIRTTTPVMSGSYWEKSGTSMATPFVSGVAGLILARRPGFSPSHLRNYILQSADMSGIYLPYVSSGGRLNAYNALHALDAPVPDFIANTTSGTAPLTVSFTDRSYAEIGDWNWTFGDGNVSVLRNPVFTYGTPGNYSVSLSVKSPAGLAALTKNDFITVSETQVVSLNVTKSASGNHLNASGPVTFTYTVKNTGAGGISSITLTDDKLGTIPGPESGDNGNGVLEPGETWTYSEAAILNLTTTNIATVAGTSGGRSISVKSNPVTVTVGALPVPEFPGTFFPAGVLAIFVLFVLIARKFRKQ